MSGPSGFSSRIKGLAIVVAVLLVVVIVGKPSEVAPPRPWVLPLPMERLELRRTGMADVVLEKTPEGWRQGEHLLDPGADAALAALFAQPLVADPGDHAGDAALDRYGLTAEALTVTAVGPQGRHIFRVGKVVDDERTFILPLPGEQVMRARANLRRTLDRPAESWRDRRIFGATVFADVQRLALTRGGRPDWSVSRDGPQAAWRLEGGGGVDEDAMGGTVNTFATLQAASFVTDPVFQAVARFDGQTFDGRQLALELGPRQPGGTVRIRRLPDGTVAELAAHRVAFLDVTAQGLADRRLFPGATEAAQGIAFGGANPLRIARGDGGWNLEAPEARALPAATVDAVVHAVLEARAAGLVGQVPPDAFTGPLYTVQVRLANDRVLTLTLGATFQQGARYARTSEGPSQTFVVSEATVQALTPTLATLTAP